MWGGGGRGSSPCAPLRCGNVLPTFVHVCHVSLCFWWGVGCGVCGGGVCVGGGGWGCVCVTCVQVFGWGSRAEQTQVLRAVGQMSEVTISQADLRNLLTDGVLGSLVASVACPCTCWAPGTDASSTTTNSGKAVGAVLCGRPQLGSLPQPVPAVFFFRHSSFVFVSVVYVTVAVLQQYLPRGLSQCCKLL
jgi:hypothetical protein